MAKGIFAGIPVKDFRISGVVQAITWRRADVLSQRHRGRVAIGRGPLRVHNKMPTKPAARSMIWVDDPITEVARIAERGLEPIGVEKHDRVWKYVFHDANGNETGIGGEVSTPE